MDDSEDEAGEKTSADDRHGRGSVGGRVLTQRLISGSGTDLASGQIRAKYLLTIAGNNNFGIFVPSSNLLP